jgi:hypothetical protein
MKTELIGLQASKEQSSNQVDVLWKLVQSLITLSSNKDELFTKINSIHKAVTEGTGDRSGSDFGGGGSNHHSEIEIKSLKDHISKPH